MQVEFPVLYILLFNLSHKQIAKRVIVRMYVFINYA